MKHTLLKSVIISVILLLGTNSVWGAVTLRYQKDMPSDNYDGNTSKTMTQSSANSNRYYCEIDLSANSNYGFFIIDGSNYYKGDYNGNVTATSNYSTEVKNYGSDNYGNSPHRVNYKSGTAGTYIFTYDASNHKICVSPKSSETIKIAYDVASGHDNNYNLDNYVNLVQSGTSANYFIDLDLQAKKYYMFVQLSNTIYWKVASTLDINKFASLYCYGDYNYGNSADKINFTPSAAGRYRFTWNHQDKTITYQRLYEVNYNGNGSNSGANPSPTYHLNGNTVTVANNTGNLTKTGYTFAGWNTKADGTGTTYAAGSGTFKMNTSNITLYAKWTINSHNVTWKANGGNWGGSTADKVVSYNYGATITKVADPTRTGYTFNAWSPAFEANTTMPDNALTYTAQWTANKYTVTLSNQGATTAGTASVQATYDAAMPSATMPTKTGYTFDGYYTSNNGGGTQYYNANGASAKNWAIASNSTLYAKWTANQYTITYKDQGNVAFSGAHASTPPTKHTYGTATALKTASKTGYTFGGWFTTQDCSGAAVTTLGATAYTSNITLYAKWTINQYTLTFLAGEGGEVTATVGGNPISSPAALDYNTQVVLTATPAGENAFKRWVDGNGTQLSTANPYTHTFKATTTIKAEFSVPTTVYLKPEDYWKSDNACFAIVASATDKSDKKIDMESADCENIYYKVDIPAGYTEFKYVRLDPNNKNTIWNETGELYAENAKGKMYVTPRMYFKPNIHWKSDNARFAVYFWKSSNISENTWRDLTHIGNDIYTCQTPGESYDRAIFCRMNPNTVDNNFNDGVTWNKTNDLNIGKIDIQGKNLYTVTKATDSFMTGDIGEWHTHWETFAPTFTVTLESSQYGKYSVAVNGAAYFSSDKKDVIIENVPYGSEVQIYDIKPHDPEVFNEDMCIMRSSNASSYERLTDNKTFTVCGNTTIKEDFVTKEDHIVYLGVPDNMITTEWWNLRKFVWAKNEITSTLIESSESSKIGEVTYYKFTIPAGYNRFCFQSKQQDGSTPTKCQSIWFYHMIPNTHVNCFVLKDSYETPQTLRNYHGDWVALPAQEGDFRLLYVEQVVKKSEEPGNEWQTIVERTYTHASDIVKKRNTAGVDTLSLHIYTRGSHPEVILQQYKTVEGKVQWVDIEVHMVNGPLEATPDKAMLPGRKNAGIGSSVDDFIYDDGIEVIKADEHDDGCGVWNFPIVQDGTTATINLRDGHLKRYTGKYYIRTDNAVGGWLAYVQPGNYMHFSQYAKDHSGFSHYFCKWVEVSNTPNTKFIIANDYGAAISDTLAGDSYTDEHGNISANANIRWSWNIVDNKVSRAYIAGSSNVADRFLVVKGNDSNIYDKDGKALTQGTNGSERYGLQANEEIFKDNGNWLYQTDIQINPGCIVNVTAKYDEKEQLFIDQKPLVDGTGVGKYPIRILYDFKINKIIAGYVPNGTNETEIEHITTNLMLIRKHHEPAVSQLVFKANEMTTNRAYGVMSFDRSFLRDNTKTNKERAAYFISFPFDVKISEVFGFGDFYKHWFIQYYDGAKRAENGLWSDSETNWTYITDPETVLEAHRGYALLFSLKSIENSGLLDNSEEVSLYFPSAEDSQIGNITSATPDVGLEIPEHICTIERNNRKVRDSNWNLIGVPAYVDVTGITNNKYTGAHQEDVYFYWRRDPSTDQYTVETAAKVDFYTMHAYMVQFAGHINWTAGTILPKQIAANYSNDTKGYHELRLELNQNGVQSDQTFIRLQDDNVTTDFDLNYDQFKIKKSIANIYSLIQTDVDQVEAGANMMPIQEAIIPIGVIIKTAGEYTFAMPDGTDGIVVELIDYETNTRTNMLLDDYTVNLGKGTFENRFALHVKPNKTTTSVGEINTNTTGVKKYLIDGILYMQKDGVLYDAQGKLVR